LPGDIYLDVAGAIVLPVASSLMCGVDVIPSAMTLVLLIVAWLKRAYLTISLHALAFTLQQMPHVLKLSDQPAELLERATRNLLKQRIDVGRTDLALSVRLWLAHGDLVLQGLRLHRLSRFDHVHRYFLPRPKTFIVGRRIRVTRADTGFEMSNIADSAHRCTEMVNFRCPGRSAKPGRPDMMVPST
jgi:hypothetical protein